MAGIGSILETWKYIQTALRRQELIAQRLLDAGVVELLDLGARPDYQSLADAVTTSRGRDNLRIDFFMLAIYLIPLIACDAFAIWSDPFGLTV